MENVAAILPSPKTPLQVQTVPVYVPGPNEVLVRNTCTALNAIEAKIVINNVLPHIPYLAILGSTYAGTIEAVGSAVTHLSPGERVAVSKRFGVTGNQYAAFQRFVICADPMIARIPAAIDLAVPASLMMNLTCVVGLFSGRLGLSRPPLLDDSTSAPVKQKDGDAAKKKILVYGGSSSFGGLSVGYLVQAGYAVVTTSSPRNRAFVEDLGAEHVIDHSQEVDALVAQLVGLGPYDVVVDFVSVASTLAVTGRVVGAQGGGRLYTMQPGREALPAGVERVFEPYSESLYEKRNEELRRWVVEEYLPEGLARGLIKVLPVEKIEGGLGGLNEGFKKVLGGGSGVRYVMDPWE